MPGLLNPQMFLNPQMHTAMGLLSAGGPSPFPVGLGQALNQGFSQGVRGMEANQAHAIQQQRQQLLKQEIAQRQAQMEAAAKQQQARTGLLGMVNDPKTRALISAGVPLEKVPGLLGAQWETLRNDQGDIVGQRNTLTGDVKADPRHRPSKMLTPEEEAQAIRKALASRPVTNINNLPKPSIQTIPGGGKVAVSFDAAGNPVVTPVVPPGETPIEKAQREKIETTSSVQDSLTRYRALLEKYGTEYMPGTGHAALSSAYNDLKVEIKELAKLGALSGPDEELIESIIADPTTFSANIGGLLTLGANKQNYLAQLDLVQQKLNAARARAAQMAPGQSAQPAVIANTAEDVGAKARKTLPPGFEIIEGPGSLRR